MSSTIECIEPFFNDATTTLPPFLHLLTDQQELFRTCARSSGLLADEALYPHNVALAVIAKSNTTSICSPRADPLLVVRPFKLAHGSSPYPKKTIKHQSNRSASIPSSDLSPAMSSDSSLSDSDETSSILSENSKIPKPSAFGRFKKIVHSLIDEHLNTTKCALVQNSDLLQTIHDKALNAIPNLDNYGDCWPVNDMIMMRLKYTSGCAQLRELELVAGKKVTRSSK